LDVLPGGPAAFAGEHLVVPAGGRLVGGLKTLALAVLLRAFAAPPQGPAGAETAPALRVRRDDEGRRLLAVEGTVRLVGAAGPLQREVLAHDLNDVQPRLHLFDFVHSPGVCLLAKGKPTGQ